MFKTDRAKTITLDYQSVTDTYPTGDVNVTLTRPMAVFLASMCEYLAWSTRWITPPPKPREFANDVMARLLTWDATGQCDDPCETHTIMSVPGITWYPSAPGDPTVPDGWANQPFFLAESTLPTWLTDLAAALGVDPLEFAGLRAGDVLTSIPNLPSNIFDMLIRGVPSFRINVSGAGTIRIKFLAIPLGGLVAIGEDVEVNILTLFGENLFGGVLQTGVELLDLNRDFSGVPPETADEIIREITFDEVGSHFIHCAFLPRIDDSAIPLGAGGGVRSIELCGFGNQIMPPQFQIVDCILQWRPTAADEWIALGNVCGADGEDGAPGPTGAAGATGATGPQGPAGAAGADGQDCDCDAAPESLIPPPGDPESLNPFPPGADARCASAQGLISFVLDRWNRIADHVNGEIAVGLAAVGIALTVLAFVSGQWLTAAAILAQSIAFLDILIDLVALAIQLGAIPSIAQGEDWLCAVQEGVTESGEITSTAVDALIDKINNSTYVAADILSAMVALIWQTAPNAIADGAYAYATAADCSDCADDEQYGEWAYEWVGSQLWNHPTYAFVQNRPAAQWQLPNGIGVSSFYSGSAFAVEVIMPSGSYTITRVEYDWVASIKNNAALTGDIFWWNPRYSPVVSPAGSGSGWAERSGTAVIDIETRTNNTASRAAWLIFGSTGTLQTAPDVYAGGYVTRLRVWGTGSDASYPSDLKVYP